MSVETLILEAAKRVGTEYKLAKALGVSPNQVYDWRDGRKPCSPADRARIAAFAGEDALQELVRATLEKHSEGVRGEQLRRVLGKSLAQTGAAIVTVLPVLASLTYGVSYLIRCALC